MPFHFSRAVCGSLGLVSLLAACGGSSSIEAPMASAPVVTQIVGGTVSTMTAGLVLQNNGADDLRLMANGGFAFASALSAGSNYNVTVRLNPPFQLCTVNNGTGIMGNADVTNISVSCVDGVQVSTLAGSSPGSADGTGAAARFSGPLAAAVDADGNVLVSDTNNNSLRKITPAGVVSTVATGLDRPFGVTFNQGRIFVASEDGNKLLEVHPTNGTFIEFVVDVPLDRPRGLVGDAHGNLYVSGYDQLINKISPAGVVTTLAGSGAIGTADGQGTAASFYNPAGLAIDAGGNVYVADQNGRTIRRISAAGTVTTLAGTGLGGATDGPGSSATFYEPVGLAMGDDGMVYTSDSAGQKIRRIAADGTVSSIAGQSISAGTNDGAGSVARFNYPTGLAFDAQGNLFAVDAGSNRIRKLTRN